MCHCHRLLTHRCKLYICITSYHYSPPFNCKMHKQPVMLCIWALSPVIDCVLTNQSYVHTYTFCCTCCSYAYSVPLHIVIAVKLLFSYADLNYLEQTSGGPDLTVATLPKSGKIVLIQVRTQWYECAYVLFIAHVCDTPSLVHNFDLCLPMKSS